MLTNEIFNASALNKYIFSLKSLVITKLNRTFVAILAIKMYNYGKRQ